LPSKSGTSLIIIQKVFLGRCLYFFFKANKQCIFPRRGGIRTLFTFVPEADAMSTPPRHFMILKVHNLAKNVVGGKNGIFYSKYCYFMPN
jgi:hypothetical protein